MKTIKNLESITTKVTPLGRGLIGCRVFVNDNLICEVRVKRKHEISSAIKDMLRTLDKLGYDSKMTKSSRYRNNNMPTNTYKFIWY